MQDKLLIYRYLVYVCLFFPMVTQNMLKFLVHTYFPQKYTYLLFFPANVTSGSPYICDYWM